MPRVDLLPTESPLTVAALRQILQLDDVTARLTAAEQAIAGSGSTIAIPATVVNLSEDTVGNGLLLQNATTPTGTLRVLEFYITGVIGSFAAGSSAAIPAVGTITIYQDGEWNFEPGADYNGVVPEITFAVTNGSAIRLSRLMISVGAINDPAIATPDGVLTPVNTAVTLNILANDYDPEGAAISLVEVNDLPVVVGQTFNVPHGTAVVNANRSVTYTPTTDYEGASAFTYRITDGVQSTVGQINIQVGFENIPLFSPVSPIFAGDYFDQAAVNFGNTAMQRYGEQYGNGVNVTSATYTSAQGNFDYTDRESWLYDRPTQIYKLYLRTGDPTHRTKALELAEVYYDGVVPTYNGADFTVGNGVPGDPKYLYPISAWWYERETGDARFRAKAHGLYTQAMASFPAPYSSGAAIWTERNMNYALQSCLADYWLTGDPQSLTNAEAYFQTLVSMSAGTGAPLHPLTQHEGTGGTTPVTSPWMGSMLVETVIQLYRTNGDTAIVEWIAGYCDFLLAQAFYVNNEVPGFLGHYVPAYLVGVGFQQRQDAGAADDAEHCFDVALLLMRGVWAKQQLGQSTTAMEARIQDLLIGARFIFGDWTRTNPALPYYRVNPPRKYGWWFNGAYTKLYFAGVVPLNPINQTLPSVSGLSPVGSTVTLDPGTWVGTPALTYQWFRFDADSGSEILIAGANALTYVLVTADNAQSVYAKVTATTLGGAITRVSNAISVTAEGSPVITQQPEISVVASGVDASFSVVANGTPAPAYEWSYSADGGSSWNIAPNGGSATLIVTAPTAQVSGYLYHCRVSNSQGIVYSEPAALYVTSQLQAVEFTASQGASLLSALLPPIASNFTMEAVVSFNGALAGNRRVLSNEYIADRVVSFGVNDDYLNYRIAVGDSQTAFGSGELPINPTDDVWYLITLSADPVADTGLFRATIQPLAGGTLHSRTRDKGLDGNLGHVGFQINGGGAASAGLNNMKFQYVRAFNTERTLVQIDADRNAVNVSEALFWWVFEDNGIGGVTVRDATGNNRVPVLTGGTLVTGPVVPAI